MKHNLSEFVRGPVLEWARYVVEERAIPSIVDGLKPSQRFYLYCSIKESFDAFEKVSAVAGPSSKFGYAHGETSLQSTGQKMAADWANNLLLIEGEGSFGTRLVQEAGAPRYTFTKLHSNFHNIMKDLDLCPAHIDPEVSIPKFYLPVLPLVLINGSKGVATGFATDIQPRSVKDVAKACTEYLKTGQIKNRISLSFPQFNGTTVWDEVKQKHIHRGTFERPSKTKLTITEVPYSFDRVSYVEILDELETNDEIVSYDDQCGDHGFRFEVTLKRQGSSDWTDDMIIKKFRLERTYTENLNVINQHGNLIHYTDERDLVKDFCEFRKTYVKARIEKKTKESQTHLAYLMSKRAFLNLVVDGEFDFKGKTKKELTSLIVESIENCTEDHAKRLLTIQVSDFSSEMIKKVEQEIPVATKEYAYWKSADPTTEFLKDLKDFT